MGQLIDFPDPRTVANAIRTSGSIAAAARALGLRERTLQERVAKGYIDGLASDPSRDDELEVIHCDFSDHDHLYLYPLGDVHAGSSRHDAKRWQEWTAYLTEAPNVAMLGMGDHFNAAIVGSKSEVYDEAMTVSGAKRYLHRSLTPLADTGKLLGLFDGNHEDRIYRAVGDSPNADLGLLLDVPYVRTAAMFVITVGEVQYEVFARHGTGNGQALTSLYKGASVAHADIYLTAHTHRLAVTSDDVFVREGDRMVRRRRVYASGGSFLGYEGYAAARGYGPSRIGGARLYLDGTRKDCHASI